MTPAARQPKNAADEIETGWEDQNRSVPRMGTARRKFVGDRESARAEPGKCHLCLGVTAVGEKGERSRRGLIGRMRIENVDQRGITQRLNR